MDSYSNYISQFTIYDSLPKKEGYDRHHIVPESEQIKLHGEVIDNRQVYVTPVQHLWLHILYDRENNTQTAQRFLSACGQSLSYFDCFEKCLAFAYTLRKKRDIRNERIKKAKLTLEAKQRQSEISNNYWSSEEARKLGSKTSKDFWTREEYRQLQTQKQKEAWNNSERRQLQSERCKQRWSNSDFKAEMSKKQSSLLWWNNGERNTKSASCPGEEWTRGRLQHKKKKCAF